MLPLLPKALHDTVLVGCNGGQVWCNGEMIYSNYFDTADVDKVLTLLNDLDVSYVLDTDWNYSFSSKFHEFYDYIRKLSVGEVKIKEAIDLGVTKILVLNGSCKSSIKEYLEVNNISNKINSHKSEEFFDITPEYTDKANTLERLGVDFGITISLGNDENDFRMLEKSLISLFVGDEKDYGRATYYCDMDTLLSTLNHAMRTLDVY